MTLFSSEVCRKAEEHFVWVSFQLFCYLWGPCFGELISQVVEELVHVPAHEEADSRECRTAWQWLSYSLLCWHLLQLSVKPCPCGWPWCSTWRGVVLLTSMVEESMRDIHPSWSSRGLRHMLPLGNLMRCLHANVAVPSLWQLGWITLWPQPGSEVILVGFRGHGTKLENRGKTGEKYQAASSIYEVISHIAKLLWRTERQNLPFFIKHLISPCPECDAMEQHSLQRRGSQRALTRHCRPCLHLYSQGPPWQGQSSCEQLQVELSGAELRATFGYCW